MPSLTEKKHSIQLRLQPLLDKVEFATSPQIVDLDSSIQDAGLQIAHIGEPKTKVLAGKLRTMGIDDVLILTDRLDQNLYLSSRNLPNVLVLEARHADPVSLMRFTKVLVTKEAVKHLEEALA